MMDRGEMNTGNTVGNSVVSGRMSLLSSLVPSYLCVILVSDDSYFVERKVLCIFNSCNSLKFSMAEKQLRFPTCLLFFFPSFCSPSLSPAPPISIVLYSCISFLLVEWVPGCLVSGFFYLLLVFFSVFYQLFLKFPYISSTSFSLFFSSIRKLSTFCSSPSYFLFSNIW